MTYDLLKSLERGVVEEAGLAAEVVLRDCEGLVPAGVLGTTLLLMPGFELLRKFFEQSRILQRLSTVDLLTD